MPKQAYGTTPARLDAILWGQAGEGRITALADVVADAQGKPAEHVVVETIIVEHTNPLDVIHPKYEDQYEVRTVGGTSVMQVDDERGPFVISAWPTAFEGVFHLIGSIPATDPRWDRVNRWINSAAPHAVRCFLDHDDFTAIGTALSEHDRVEVQRVTGRVHADRSSWSRGFPLRTGDDVRPDHHTVLIEAESLGASFRTLHLHVGDVMDVLLRRIAGATFYRGDFEVFENRVLARLAVAAHRRRDLLSNRHRVVHEPAKRPIEIRLPEPILTDASATADVVRSIATERDVTYAVLHRNPYLHVVVTDNSDGSNYDVFVTRPDAIEIHPGYRASLGSLTRIAQSLSLYFEASDLRETPVPEKVSLRDLIAN
jgi:hypothetical protein